MLKPVSNILVSVISVCLVQMKNSADTIVVGDQSGIWDIARSPYFITSDVLVPSSQVLKIEPGVTVILGTDRTLRIDGEVLALGTKERPIMFKEVGSKFRWREVLVTDISNVKSRFEYCVFSGAQRALSLYTYHQEMRRCLSISLTALSRIAPRPVSTGSLRVLGALRLVDLTPITLS